MDFLEFLCMGRILVVTAGPSMIVPNLHDNYCFKKQSKLNCVRSSVGVGLWLSKSDPVEKPHESCPFCTCESTAIIPMIARRHEGHFFYSPQFGRGGTDAPVKPDESSQVQALNKWSGTSYSSITNAVLVSINTHRCLRAISPSSRQAIKCLCPCLTEP